MIVQFNPESLFDLIRQQCSNPSLLIQKIIACNKGFWESKNYFHCINDSIQDNNLGIANTIILTGHPKGLVAIDMCKNGHIAGIEYIDQMN